MKDVVRVVWSGNTVYLEDKEGNLELVGVCPDENRAIRVINGLRMLYTLPSRKLQDVKHYPVRKVTYVNSDAEEEEPEKEDLLSHLQELERRAEWRQRIRSWRMS